MERWRHGCGPAQATADLNRQRKSSSVLLGAVAFFWNFDDTCSESVVAHWRRSDWCSRSMRYRIPSDDEEVVLQVGSYAQRFVCAGYAVWLLILAGRQTCIVIEHSDVVSHTVQISEVHALPRSVLCFDAVRDPHRARELFFPDFDAWRSVSQISQISRFSRQSAKVTSHSHGQKDFI